MSVAMLSKQRNITISIKHGTTAHNFECLDASQTNEFLIANIYITVQYI